MADEDQEETVPDTYQTRSIIYDQETSAKNEISSFLKQYYPDVNTKPILEAVNGVPSFAIRNPKLLTIGFVLFNNSAKIMNDSRQFIDTANAELTRVFKDEYEKNKDKNKLLEDLRVNLYVMMRLIQKNITSFKDISLRSKKT